MWDTSIVITYLRDLPPVQEISLKTLTLKLAMLCALVTGQRCQSIHLMNWEQLFMGTISSRNNTAGIDYTYFSRRTKAVCIHLFMWEYIKRTKPHRGGETRLFISYIKPHKWVSKDTIARWVKIVMQQAGLEERLFKPHSTTLGCLLPQVKHFVLMCR